MNLRQENHLEQSKNINSRFHNDEFFCCSATHALANPIHSLKASTLALPSPYCEADISCDVAESTTTVRVVSRRGSSKAVGSARIRFLLTGRSDGHA